MRCAEHFLDTAAGGVAILPACLAQRRRENTTPRTPSPASDHAPLRSSDTAAPRASETTNQVHCRTRFAATVFFQAPSPVADRVQGLAATAAPIPMPFRPTIFQRPPTTALLYQLKPQEIHQGDCQIECSLQHPYFSPHVLLQYRESGNIE